MEGLLLHAQWKRIIAAYSGATHGTVSVCNNKGEVIAKHKNDLSLCHSCDDGEINALCARCRALGGYEAFRQNKPYVYYCARNQVCVAVPLVMGDNYIGAVIAEGIRVRSFGEAIDGIAEPDPDTASKEEDVSVIDYEMILKVSELMQVFCFYITEGQRGSYVSKKTDKPIISERITSTSRKEQSWPSRDSVSMLFPAFDYIATHFVERISVQYLADLCHMSTSYFSRLFAKETRDKLPQYIMKLRIAYAKQQLSTTEKSVAVIAVDSGFSDSSHFIRAFKNVEGVTPSQYRKMVVRGEK